MQQKATRVTQMGGILKSGTRKSLINTMHMQVDAMLRRMQTKGTTQRGAFPIAAQRQRKRIGHVASSCRAASRLTVSTAATMSDLRPLTATRRHAAHPASSLLK